MRYVKKYKPFLWPKSTFWRGILSFPVELEQMWFSLSSFRVLFTAIDDHRRQVRQQRQRTLWKFGSAGAWRRPLSLTPGWLVNARDMLNQSEGVYGQRFRVSQHSVTPPLRQWGAGKMSQHSVTPPLRQWGAGKMNQHSVTPLRQRVENSHFGATF